MRWYSFNSPITTSPQNYLGSNYYYPNVAVREFIEILLKIERMDVAEVLESEWIADFPLGNVFLRTNN